MCVNGIGSFLGAFYCVLRSTFHVCVGNAALQEEVRAITPSSLGAERGNEGAEAES